MSVSDDVRSMVGDIEQLETDLDEKTKECDELQAQLDAKPQLDPSLVTRIEEHVIRLQDEDVKNGTSVHAETIALLRECKA